MARNALLVIKLAVGGAQAGFVEHRGNIMGKARIEWARDVGREALRITSRIEMSRGDTFDVVALHGFCESSTAYGYLFERQKRPFVRIAFVNTGIILCVKWTKMISHN